METQGWCYFQPNARPQYEVYTFTTKLWSEYSMYLSCVHIITYYWIDNYYILLYHFTSFLRHYIISLSHNYKGKSCNDNDPIIMCYAKMVLHCYHYYVIIASLLLHYYKGSYYYPILLIWVSWLGTCRWCLSLRLMLQYLYPYPINRTGSILVLAAAVFIPHNLELCVLS